MKRNASLKTVETVESARYSLIDVEKIINVKAGFHTRLNMTAPLNKGAVKVRDRGLYKQAGITLIALVITIIIMLILAGVALTLAIGNNGIINNAKISKEKYEKAAEREQLELVLQDAQIAKETNSAYTETEFLNNFIGEKITTAEINDDVVRVNKYSFLIDRQESKIISEVENVRTEEPIPGSGLTQKITEMNTSGNYAIEVTGKKEDNSEDTVTYNINLIAHNGNLKLDGNTPVDGVTPSEKVYEFGNKEVDVATQTANASNMVVLKVKGNLTIDEGVTLTACKSDEGYGGPKGLMIYCTGTLTNKGKISMTARGAKAEGQNVFLWENSDGSFEYVPKDGATGGGSVYNKSVDRCINGNAGQNGLGRQTGGGASGACTYGDSYGSAYSGAGTAGTSYSGGTRRWRYGL